MKGLVVYPESKERQLRIMRYEEHVRARRIKHYIAYSPIGDTIIGKWASRSLVGVSRMYVRTKYNVYLFAVGFYQNRWKYAFQGTLILAAFYTYSNEQDRIREVFNQQYTYLAASVQQISDDQPEFKRVAYKIETPVLGEVLSKLDDNKVQAYIKRFSRVATLEMEKYGIPASIKVALAILASEGGTTTESIKSHNHFGKPMEGPDYQSAWENWRAHTLMLKDQYPELFYLEPNSQQWAIGLQKLDYSDAPDFAKTLLEIVDRFELDYLNEI